jgi:hypothetical protein
MQFLKTIHCSHIWMLLLPFSLFSQTTNHPDTSVSEVQIDTASLSRNHAPDTAATRVKDTLSQKIDRTQPGILSKSTPDTLSRNTTDTSASPKLRNGLHFGAGIGWAMGNMDIVQLWRATLTDSLSQYNLTASSFKVDTSFSNPAYIDTAQIKCVIRQHPEPHNITFPVTLSLVRITDTRKYGVALSFAYFDKTMKSVITGTVDSLSESVNIKQHLSTFSFALSGNYSLLIPAEYFTIEGVERSHFTFSFGCAPQIIQKKGLAEYNGRNARLKSVQQSTDAVLDNQISVGAGIMARAGITSLHAINAKSALEFGVSFTISRFDYFYADGHRLTKGWLDPHSKDHNTHLSYLSNRFEVSVSFLRRREDSVSAVQNRITNVHDSPTHE